jgi:hypothetical protein
MAGHQACDGVEPKTSSKTAAAVEVRCVTVVRLIIFHNSCGNKLTEISEMATDCVLKSVFELLRSKFIVNPVALISDPIIPVMDIGKVELLLTFTRYSGIGF